MEHTFDTVDEKVAESEFFLGKMAGAGMDLFALKCYLSAYLSASRTVTLALQQFKHLPGFEAWYEPHRKRLEASALAKFFHETRNAHAHGAPYPVAGARFNGSGATYRFGQLEKVKGPPPDDMVAACREHFLTLLEIVYDCYVELGVYIDPQQYFTKEHFAANGRTIDDAEVEVWGWVRTSLIEEGFDEDGRWHELRSHVSECKINHLFYSYLGEPTPQPELPEDYYDFEFTPEEKGWVHVPVGFKTLEEYRTSRGLSVD